MAQVLYYHRWPQSVAAQPAYTDDKKQTVEALKATTLKWDKMLDSYQGNTATEEQQQAVAELMRYCGQAMKMDSNCPSMPIEHAWALCSNGKVEKLLTPVETMTVTTSNYDFNRQVSFGSHLDNDTYELRHVYRAPGTTQWTLSKVYNDDDNNLEMILLATINGNELDLVYPTEKTFTVNDVKVNGDMVEGRPINLTVSWTRHGYQDKYYVYAQFKDEKKPQYVSAKPRKGINLMRMNNGTTRKVMVQ